MVIALHEAFYSQADPAAECVTSDGSVVKAGHRIIFTGEINNESVECFVRLADSTTSELEITSQGSAGDNGVRMGEEVFSRNMDVTVNGYCLSGCASFVFIAGRISRLREGAVLGFHKTSTSYLLIAINLGLTSLEDRLTERSSREKRLYERVGVSTDLLFAPEANIQPVCMTSETGLVAQLTSRISFWYPDSRTMEAFGVNIDRVNWHDSQEDLAQRLSIIDRRFGLSFAFGSSYDNVTSLRVLSAVSMC